MSKHFSSPDIVAAIFRFLLDREPDATGLSTYSDELDRGRAIDEVMKMIAQSEEFRLKFHLFFQEINR